MIKFDNLNVSIFGTTVNKEFAYSESIPQNQFVYPNPKGSELILPAPFRVGVNREKKFARIACMLNVITKIN
jgi:hypothetical protein